MRVVYIQVPVDPGVRSSPKRVSRTPVKMAGPAGTTSTPLPACVHSASLATGQSTSVIGHQHLGVTDTGLRPYFSHRLVYTCLCMEVGVGVGIRVGYV